MAQVTSSEYKVKCMAYLSYATVDDMAEYFHLSPIWGSDENIAKKFEGFHFSNKQKFDFSALFDLPMDDQKCCSECKHHCYGCGMGNICKETVDCAKYPCENCGKVSNNCRYQKLRATIVVFKSLVELCNVEKNYDCFESQSEFVFPQFPFCYSVELLWDRVNTALEFCLEFLLKSGYINDDTVNDRLMDFRLILKRPKHKIAAVFGDDIIEMFPALASERPDEIVDADETPKKSKDDELPANEGYYYYLANGKKVWLKNKCVLRRTFILDEKVFDGAIFKYQTEKRDIVIAQYQVDGEGWVDLNQPLHTIKFYDGFLHLTTNNWLQEKRYDVRVLLTTLDENLFDSIEYFGCSVKERCSGLNDEELKKNWKFDELKRLVKSKDIPVLQDILSANKKLVSLLDGSKNTMLHWAAQYSSPEVAELLIKKGIDVFAKNKEGATAYHQAASYNIVSVMKILLTHNKKGLNEQDADLYTPLHYACLNNCVDVARYLTQQDGINVDLKSKKGKKPDEIYARTREDIKKMIMVCRAKQ